LTKKAPYKGLGADSEEKHEPVSDIDTVLVDSLKALDPKRPIREADIRTFSLAPSRMFAKADTMGRIESGVAMRRRTFLGVLGGVAVAWPNEVGAQQPTLPTIGFLITGTPPFAGELAAFKKGLAESGFVDGQNLTIEYRWAENRLDRLSAMAVDLVKRQVSVLVAGGGAPSAFAAKAATSTIPILFSGAGDPVKLGLVASLNQPGGNITGVSFVAVELVSKRMELLRELLPEAKAIAMISAGRDPDEAVFAKNAAQALGLKIEFVTASSDRDLEAAFTGVAARRADAVLVGTSPTFVSSRAQIVALAARHTIPTIYARREYVVDGGLISYSPPVTEAYRQVGVYTGRIFRGDKASDLPVVQPTKFELTINLKSAKALGIDVPPTLLARADEVIE
jgi:putative ABC transport system substrate-binding protein